MRAGATSPVSAIIHALLVLLALLVLAPWLSYLPLAAMAALLLMVARNMSEAHKVIYLLRRAPKDDILVLLLCMSLTVLFDMVIAITVGIVLASLLFMRRIARMTRLSELSAGDGRLVLRVNGPLFFAAAERIFTELLARSGLSHDRAAMGCGAGARCRRPERPAALYRRAACGQKAGDHRRAVPAAENHGARAGAADRGPPAVLPDAAGSAGGHRRLNVKKPDKSAMPFT